MEGAVLNGASRVEHGNSREVRVDAVIRVDAAGHVENFVHLSGTVTARSRLSATLTISGRAEPAGRPPSEIDRVLEKGLADATTERALRIFGRDEAHYRDL